MAYRVFIVSPNGDKHLAGNVKSYKLKATAQAAQKHYDRFIESVPTMRGYRTELESF